MAETAIDRLTTRLRCYDDGKRFIPDASAVGQIAEDLRELLATEAKQRQLLDMSARELQKGALDVTEPLREIAGLRTELDAIAAERDQLRAELERLRHGAEAPSGRCEDCGCCTASGCRTGTDSTCPTDRLGDSVCPCTGD